MFNTTATPKWDPIFLFLFLLCLCLSFRKREGEEDRGQGRREGGRGGGVQTTHKISSRVFMALKFIDSLLSLTQSKYMARKPSGIWAKPWNVETGSVWSPWLFPGIWTRGPACLRFCLCQSVSLGMRQSKDVASLTCLLLFVCLTVLIQRNSLFQESLGIHSCPKQGPRGLVKKKITREARQVHQSSQDERHSGKKKCYRLVVMSPTCQSPRAPRDDSSTWVGSWVEMGVVYNGSYVLMGLTRRWGIREEWSSFLILFKLSL